MAKFKTGDHLVFSFMDAIQVQQMSKGPLSPWAPAPQSPDTPHIARPTGVVVVGEESPGKYRCLTPFGVTMLIDETRLSRIDPPGDATVMADIAGIMQATTP